MPDVSAIYGIRALAAPIVPAANYYLSLHSTDPGITGINEIAGGSYARQLITFSVPVTTIAFTSGFQQSTNAQQFLNMPAISGNLWFGIWDALTGGNYWIGGTSAAVTGPILLASTINFSTNSIVIEAI